MIHVTFVYFSYGWDCGRWWRCHVTVKYLHELLSQPLDTDACHLQIPRSNATQCNAMQRPMHIMACATELSTHSTVQPFKMANIYDFDHENVAKIAYKINFTKSIIKRTKCRVFNTKRLIYFPSRWLQCEKCLSKISSVVWLCASNGHLGIFFLIICYLFSTQFVYLPKHRIWKLTTLNYTRTKTQSSFTRFGVQIQ